MKYKCEICHKTFRHKDYLKKHIDVEHLSHEKSKDKCDICDGMYKSKRLLQTHQHRIHEMKANRKCTFCHKHFNRPSVLKEHIQVEHFGHFHKCEICDKTFRHKDNLKKHMKRHQIDQEQTLRKPKNLKNNYEPPKIQCNLCNNLFSSILSLKEHVSNVHGERKFSCDLCNREFPTNRNLKQHQKSKNHLALVQGDQTK